MVRELSDQSALRVDMSELSDLLRDTFAPINNVLLDNPSQPAFLPSGAPPPGGSYGAFYAFGDSLTDTGNASLATFGMVPVSPPYADRSFSNGPVWAQDLAQTLGLPQLQPSLAGGTDFAFGGAHAGQTLAHTLNPTDLPGQYGQFLAQVPSPQPNALYGIWIGSNDVFDIADNTSLTSDQQTQAVSAAVDNEMAVINGLVQHGARNLLVLNVPDLGETPHEQSHGAAAVETAHTLSMQYDAALSAALVPLEQSGAVRVDLIDTFQALQQVKANPGAYGFTDVNDPVWTGNLTDPGSGTLRATGSAQNQFLFFDAEHPTAAAHSMLAAGIAPTLSATA